MYDIAYQVELSICVAEKERNKLWNRILSVSPLCSVMVECLELGRWCSMIDYSEMFYATHGV